MRRHRFSIVENFGGDLSTAFNYIRWLINQPGRVWLICFRLAQSILCEASQYCPLVYLVPVCKLFTVELKQFRERNRLSFDGAKSSDVIFPLEPVILFYKCIISVAVGINPSSPAGWKGRMHSQRKMNENISRAAFVHEVSFLVSFISKKKTSIRSRNRKVDISTVEFEFRHETHHSHLVQINKMSRLWNKFKPLLLKYDMYNT